jgi:hypoxanthine phosphoribosyltransferase
MSEVVAPIKIRRVLISTEELAARVGELGRAIGRDYAGRTPLLVGVLKGASVFLADLIRAIPGPVGIDYIGLSSYGAGTRTSGVVRVTTDLSVSIEGRDVVIVEDIIDTGRTVEYLRRNLMTRDPRSLALCTLLDKIGRREVQVPIDYAGFVIPDEFVVGYGLDHGGYFRTLPYLAVVEDPLARLETRAPG